MPKDKVRYIDPNDINTEIIFAGCFDPVTGKLECSLEKIQDDITYLAQMGIKKVIIYLARSEDFFKNKQQQKEEKTDAETIARKFVANWKTESQKKVERFAKTLGVAVEIVDYEQARQTEEYKQSEQIVQTTSEKNSGYDTVKISGEDAKKYVDRYIKHLKKQGQLKTGDEEDAFRKKLQEEGIIDGIRERHIGPEIVVFVSWCLKRAKKLDESTVKGISGGLKTQSGKIKNTIVYYPGTICNSQEYLISSLKEKSLGGFNTEHFAWVRDLKKLQAKPSKKLENLLKQTLANAHNLQVDKEDPLKEETDVSSSEDEKGSTTRYRNDSTDSDSEHSQSSQGSPTISPPSSPEDNNDSFFKAKSFKGSNMYSYKTYTSSSSSSLSTTSDSSLSKSDVVEQKLTNEVFVVSQDKKKEEKVLTPSKQEKQKQKLIPKEATTEEATTEETNSLFVRAVKATMSDLGTDARADLLFKLWQKEKDEQVKKTNKCVVRHVDGNSSVYGNQKTAQTSKSSSNSPQRSFSAPNPTAMLAQPNNGNSSSSHNRLRSQSFTI